MATTTLQSDTRTGTGLDRHFALPEIRAVPASEPFVWLRRGWHDLRANWTLSAGYGVLFALAGWMVLLLAAPRPYLFTAAVTGFMLVAPLLAAGLYEISRRHGKGMTLAHHEESLRGWTRNGSSMALFGLLLGLVAIAWERLSAVLFALFYDGALPRVDTFLSTVLLSGDYWSFVVAYLGLGALLAAGVFATSVITVPALVDRKIDVATAIAISVKAVQRNPAAMVVWAALLVVLVALGFATLLLGMVVLLPWAAHASWHAYRGLVTR